MKDGEYINPYVMIIPGSIVKDKTISSSAKLCLVRLFELSNREGRCPIPNQETLAKDIGVEKTVIPKLLKELEKENYIEKTKEGDYAFLWKESFFKLEEK